MSSVRATAASAGDPRKYYFWCPRALSRKREPTAAMAPSTCVFTCRHPAWGGQGICSTDHDHAPICLCDAGFASRDALGHASCVPYRVLVTGYLGLAAGSLFTMVLLGWQLAGYLRLSDEARRSRKTSIRLGVLLSGRYRRLPPIMSRAVRS